MDNSIILSEEFQTMLDGKIGEVNSNSIVFPDGPFDGMVTVTYSDNTATLTVDGTDYVSENNVNNVWKTEFGLTSPNVRFYTNDVNEAKYVGYVLGETLMTVALKTDGSFYSCQDGEEPEILTAQEIRDSITARKNSDTSVKDWITITTNYIQNEQKSKRSSVEI